MLIVGTLKIEISRVMLRLLYYNDDHYFQLKNRQLWLYEPVCEVVLLLSFVSFSWSYSPLLLWSLLLSNRWHYYQLDFCLVFSSVVFPRSISYSPEGTEYLPALDHIISLPGHEYIFLDILNCQPFVLRYLENLKINIDFIIIFISPIFTYTIKILRIPILYKNEITWQLIKALY